MSDDLSQIPTQRRWRKLTRRERAWLTGLAAFTLIALVAWKPLRHELMMSLALHSDGPSDSVLSELADQAPNRAQTLKRMWRSGNLTAREFVLDYLKTHLHAELALITQMQIIVREAARDPDIKVREPALNILAKDKSPESLALIRDQLTDADPAVRVMVLQNLYHIAESNDVPTTIRLLDDADPRVAVQASVLLRKVTGFDSGIRTSDALPNFIRSEDGTPPQEPHLAVIQRGVQRWREWWNSNRMEFPDSVAPLQKDMITLPMKDFTLENLDGRVVRLSDFHGKAVLLCFWKSDDSRSFDDLAVLKQLQEQQDRRLTVVGVAFDSSVGPQDDCAEEGHGHGQEPMMMNGRMMVMNVSQVPIKSVIRDAVAERQIPFPVLLDTKGTLAFRYNVQEITTYVLIDAQGNLRRRFAGSRELLTWTAMVKEISGL